MLILMPALLSTNWEPVKKCAALPERALRILSSRKPESVKDVAFHASTRMWVCVEEEFDKLDDPELIKACAKAFNRQARKLANPQDCWSLSAAFTQKSPLLLALIAPVTLHDTILSMEKTPKAELFPFAPPDDDTQDPDTIDTECLDKIGERIVAIAVELTKIVNPALAKAFRDSTQQLSNPLKTRFRIACDACADLAPVFGYPRPAQTAVTAQP